MSVIIQHVTFSHRQLTALPHAEQLLFVGLARILNDLRYVRTLVQTNLDSVKNSSGEARRESLHRLVFSLRLLYGTLNEGWNLTRKCWSRNKLGKTFYERLPQDAKDAYGCLKKYFGNSNYVEKVRNNLAFHYDDESFQTGIKRADPNDIYSMIVGRINGNQFFAFAEALHRVAIAEIAGPGNDDDAVGKFMEEASFLLLPKFVMFADAAIFEVGKSFLPQNDLSDGKSVTDVS